MDEYWNVGQMGAKNRILNNTSSIRVPNDHRKRVALIIIAEEQGYNEDQ